MNRTIRNIPWRSEDHDHISRSTTVIESCRTHFPSRQTAFMSPSNNSSDYPITVCAHAINRGSLTMYGCRYESLATSQCLHHKNLDSQHLFRFEDRFFRRRGSISAIRSFLIQACADQISAEARWSSSETFVYGITLLLSVGVADKSVA